ncbi:MAG: FAD-binding oxidoreductase [Gammaproteobacteria bacterium]|nr:MAG: FAD-binding oxidoreductase [Gammaproteobacteria bacterium]
MQRTASRTGHYRKLTIRAPLTVRPKGVEEIVAVLTNSRRFPSPVRPVGAGSGNARCVGVQGGTICDMTAMNRVLQIRSRSVKVQAGMRLRDLARKLAKYDLELVGSYEQLDRTVGGLISSGSLSAGLPDDGAHLASTVTGVGIVTAQGQIVEYGESLPEMLDLVRQGYGLIGIVYSVTLKIRKIRSYSIRNRKVGFAELVTIVPSLARTATGVKLFLLPFRDRIYIELRDANVSDQKPGSFAWKVRDWISNRILPDIVHSVGKIVPVGRIRDPLIDGFSAATQMLVNTRFVDVGSNAMEQTGQFRKIGPSSRISYCTWLYPADKFGAALYSYREFCRRHYAITGFRCDLPAVGYRISQDRSALLSPSFDGPVFALNLRTTNTDDWDDFLLDFAKIATHFGGIPSLNQTRGFTADQVAGAYGRRLDRFKAFRRRFDPENRLLNQFFAEFVG